MNFFPSLRYTMQYGVTRRVMELEEIILTFPDGSLVSPGQLNEWLSAVNACPDFDQEQRDTAAAIVARIRVLSN